MQSIVERNLADPTLPYVFFYGEHRPNGVFSNFYMSNQTKNYGNRTMTFHSNEQFIMYEKAILMGDINTANDIMLSDSPLQCKRLGRRVSPWDEEVWKDNALSICIEGLRAKFAAPDLARALLQTGNAILAEAAPRDLIWGIGYGPNNPNSSNYTRWRGTNYLGICLMEVRTELRG